MPNLGRGLVSTLGSKTKYTRVMLAGLQQGLLSPFPPPSEGPDMPQNEQNLGPSIRTLSTLVERKVTTPPEWLPEKADPQVQLCESGGLFHTLNSQCPLFVTKARGPIAG